MVHTPNATSQPLEAESSPYRQVFHAQAIHEVTLVDGFESSFELSFQFFVPRQHSPHRRKTDQTIFQCQEESRICLAALARRNLGYNPGGDTLALLGSIGRITVRSIAEEGHHIGMLSDVFSPTL